MILDGRKLRDKILADLKTKVDAMPVKPTLAVVLAGDNPASKIYVNNKQKTAQGLGINSVVERLPADVTEEVLLGKIAALNNDPGITAILVQLPLPAQIDKDNIINAICPEKDVDGFTPQNFGLLFSGQKPYVYPCTPMGIELLLDEYNVEIAGKHVVVIGRSNIVGKPAAQMMLNRDATVTVCHSRTGNLAEITRTADILISATGARIIREGMVKKGCVVVDTGIFKDENGKTVGDVDFDAVSKDAAYITPVPGGVGPMTIASLMINTVKLFERD
jgi:methylenetetrahydrofolate dehydrogenase (NADP+)/methenyltetrahydrofolate cyclohydrolase